MKFLFKIINAYPLTRLRQVSRIGIFLFLISCSNEPKPGSLEDTNEAKAEKLYQTYCGSCHITPDIEHLPKDLWAEKVLPEMAARLGIKEGNFNPYDGMKFEEMEILHKAQIYPYAPALDSVDWNILKSYVLENAPDSLPNETDSVIYRTQDHFVAESRSLDTLPGAYFTYLKYSDDAKKIWAGEVSGYLMEHDFRSSRTKTLNKVESAVVDYTRKDTIAYITDVGILNPSDLSSGKIITTDGENQNEIPLIFHRPVNNLVVDLNNDGQDEMVICEFGHQTGQLTLLTRKSDGSYEKKMLLTQPGTIRTLARDMDKDGKLDLVTLTSQGDESITILYQKEDLRFSIDKAIRFSPIYGSSWFEIVDFDKDGDDDIITVNGDNADKTYISKPYHGMRIFLNDGQNNFSEAYFFQLNGATRFVAHDFDEDDDIDFVLISTFPDYDNHPNRSVVYLENKNAENFDFEPLKFEEANFSRWLLLDKGDVDQDGDMDVILSAFTYTFTPVPDEFLAQWNSNRVDLLILKNQLREKGTAEGTK